MNGFFRSRFRLYALFLELLGKSYHLTFDSGLDCLVLGHETCGDDTGIIGYMDMKRTERCGVKLHLDIGEISVCNGLHIIQDLVCYLIYILCV